MNRVAACLALSFLLGISACGGGGTSYSYQNVTVAIAPQIASLPVGGTQTFSTSVTNAPNFPLWTLDGSILGTYASTGAGTFSEPTTDAPTGTYTAPATPPIYTQAQVAAGQAQGTVTLGAFIHSSQTNVFDTVYASTTFAITGPISAGVLPTAATVPLGTTLQLSPYVVGTLTNGYTLKVNGFVGGGTAVGTISPTGLYTAPTVMPVTGNTITISVVSVADTTKVGTATITLQ